MRAFPRCLLVLSLTLAVAAPAWSDSPEDVARRYLSQIYDGRFDDLPRTQTARTVELERLVRNTLRTRCVRNHGLALSLVHETDQRATLHADLAIAKSEIASPLSWSPVEIVPLRVVLVRIGESWFIDEVRNRDDELAGRLLQADRDARESLLREGFSKGLGRALYARALAALNAGRFKEAADAAALSREIAIAVGDRGGEALALGAATYTKSPADLDAARRLGEESLAIAETLSDPDVLARAWYDHGRNFPGRNSPPSTRAANAIECYQNARAFAQRAEDRTILARVLYSLANLAANSQSDYLKARRYIDEGMAISRETGDEAGEMGFEMVLATVYFEQGDRERGLFHHERATELAKKTRSFAYPTLLVRSGCLLVDAGRSEEGRAALEKLIVRNKDGVSLAFGSAPGSTIGSALRCLAVAEARTGRFNEADCLNRESDPYHNRSAGTYLFELAPQYLERGQPARALASALSSLGTDGLKDPQRVTALVAAGRAYRSLGNHASGLAAALEAIELREAVASRIAGDEQQRASAERATSECYELAAELELDRGDVMEALALLERGRARVLTDILENGRPGATAELDAAMRQREEELDAEVARVSRDLDRARASDDEKAAGELAAQMSRARATRASFLDGVRARTERRAATRRRIDAAGLRELAARLPPHTVAIEYFVGERDLHIFVAGADGVVARARHIERSELDRRAKRFVEMLAQNDLRVEAEARALHSLILGPIEREIAAAKTLLVVPDDVLWQVPLAALMDRRGRFLVESKAIVYAPSILAWWSITDSRKHREPSSVPLLAIGNPAPNPIAREAAASHYRNATLGPLPDAEHEVDAVRALYDHRRSIVLKRDQATEGRTKSALRDAGIAHFATHAILDDTNPMYSRLMLARDEQGSEDGWLESWEVARLDLDADLVVLSACDTARGRVGGGEGVVGLSWSFFLAGASSIVATQWKVASSSTAEFMIAFHRALHAPATDPALHKAQSLREAQLQLLRDKRTRHPFHWAPFVLLGDASSRPSAE